MPRQSQDRGRSSGHASPQAVRYGLWFTGRPTLWSCRRIANRSHWWSIAVAAWRHLAPLASTARATQTFRRTQGWFQWWASCTLVHGDALPSPIWGLKICWWRICLLTLLLPADYILEEVDGDALWCWKICLSIDCQKLVYLVLRAELRGELGGGDLLFGWSLYLHQGYTNKIIAESRTLIAYSNRIRFICCW